MRQFRKVQFIAMALLPFVACFAFVLSNIGNTQGTEYIPLGGFDIVDGSIVCDVDTWCDMLLGPLFDDTSGIWDTFADLLEYLHDSIGLPYSMPVLGGLIYGLWGVYITLLQLLLDLILFVPRKCMEFVGGKIA